MSFLFPRYGRCVKFEFTCRCALFRISNFVIRVSSLAMYSRFAQSLKSAHAAAKWVAWPLHGAAALHGQQARDDLIAFFQTFDDLGADAVGNTRLNFDGFQF